MRIALALSLSFFALAAVAEDMVEVRFLPPAPTSQTAITTRLSGVWHDSSFPRCANAQVAGPTIIISICQGSQVGLPVLTPWELDVWIGLLQPGIYDVKVLQSSPPGTSAVITLAESRLIVQEVNPAFEITPNVQLPGINDSVVITGALLECRDTGLCDEPAVRFGDRPATITRFDTVARRLEVRPPLGSGTVDVTLTFGSATARRIAAFHYVNVSQRPVPEFHAPVLFPVFFSVNGAFGSRWDTEGSVRNENDYGFLTPYGSPFDVFCLGCTPPTQTSTSPHSTRTVRASQNGMVLPNGSLTYIPRQGEEKLHFGLLVRDLSRQNEALGAEIPVVREDDLYDDSFTLLNIPNDDRFRSALRIYSIDKSGTVRVVIRPMLSETPIAEAQLVLAVNGFVGQHQGSVAIGDVVVAWPQTRGRGPLRIEIIGVSPGDLRLWAFVTVTNNETQHVTVISPQ